MESIIKNSNTDYEEFIEVISKKPHITMYFSKYENPLSKHINDGISYVTSKFNNFSLPKNREHGSSSFYKRELNDLYKRYRPCIVMSAEAYDVLDKQITVHCPVIQTNLLKPTDIIMICRNNEREASRFIPLSDFEYGKTPTWYGKGEFLDILENSMYIVWFCSKEEALNPYNLEIFVAL